MRPGAALPRGWRRTIKWRTEAAFRLAACGEARIAEKHASGAKQAAEKGLFAGEMIEKHPAGAKAHPFIAAVCGPTKVVPLLQNLS
jgi:hypothetical protein